MLAELKFVMGSVARKDYVPAMTHFVIENGTVRGWNGVLALCSPIPFDIACKPKAAPMYQAVRNCTETVSLSLTAAGRLSIKSGKFKAFVECVEGETNHVVPEGEVHALDGKAFVNALSSVAGFMADDASRPWSNGVLLKGTSAFATNNVVLVEYWTGVAFPTTVNVPRSAVKEILRIDEVPVSCQFDQQSFSLHYPNGRWIRSQLLSTDWPDFERLFADSGDMRAIDPLVFEGLDQVAPFADKTGRVMFHNGTLCTSKVEGDGAVFEIPSCVHEGSYNASMLALLQPVAKYIDWSKHPKPVPFQGDRIRGVIVGLRDL